MEEATETPPLPMRTGGFLYHVEKTYKLYYNRASMLYGPTNTGKSIIVLEAMKLLAPRIPIWFVICPTNVSHGLYTDRVPDFCIKKTTDPAFIDLLYKRQELAADLYRKVNNPKTLQSLYSLAPSNAKIEAEIKRAMYSAQANINKLKNSNLSADHKLGAIADIRQNLIEYINGLQKQVIMKHRASVSRRIESELSRLAKNTPLATEWTNLKTALIFVDFVPDVGVVLDDTGADMKDTSKKKSKESAGFAVLTKLCFQGRHNFMTALNCWQELIPGYPSLRTNPRTTIFTNAESATSFFQVSTTNGVSKELHNRAMAAIEVCFSSDKFNKLVYIREERPDRQFQYIRATSYKHIPFRVGCPALWEFDKKLPKAHRAGDIASNALVGNYVV